MVVVHIIRPITTAKVDISKLLGSQDEEEKTTSTVPSMAAGTAATGSATLTAFSPILSPPSAVITDTMTAPITSPQTERPSIPTRRSQPPQGQQPGRRSSKWTPEENSLIIQLRGSGMKWDDISKRFPGRSPISCRLHYQNYLERRSQWDEDRKNKLARLYERLRKDMWSKIADEMNIPWRAAEAMHWKLGEKEMARRAGVPPFNAIDTDSEPPQKIRRVSTTPQRPRGEPDNGGQAQLPSVAELTAGVPAYAPQQKQHYTRRRAARSPSQSTSTHIDTRSGSIPRTRR
ncbi:hypothetical protein AJ80_09629 [Polytolypa hystricis UAMH7299]|uniref:MYB DNA-binding domain protein n=1 Tax=Polytolypa hystricis (strain UAMH7299) TaxID=1447883 RepID=A0A2B7WMS7_POLH7|nr:hypothetical protein AJ80_09629 [Polytolypa hystricis UAMH7299]